MLVDQKFYVSIHGITIKRDTIQMQGFTNQFDY